VKSARDVIIRPVVSEKSYEGLEANQYTFLVHQDASKGEIKQAVEQIWSVQVLQVNTLQRKGKKTRFRFTYGKRPDEKRAIVKLAPGDSIDIFEEQ